MRKQAKDTVYAKQNISWDILKERNPFAEPYVKHFSVERYRRLYEVRIMARVISMSEPNIRIIIAFPDYRNQYTEEQITEYFAEAVKAGRKFRRRPVLEYIEVKKICFL